MMANADYGNLFLFTGVACLGCFFLVLLSLLLDRMIRNKAIDKALTFIGQNTLVIFAVQKPVINIFQRVFTVIPCPDFIALIITCIGTVIISCIAAMFVNRFIPVMAGRIQAKTVK